MKVKIISPLDKPGLADSFDALTALSPYPVFRGEPYAFHIAACEGDGGDGTKQICSLSVEVLDKAGDPAPGFDTRVYTVESVPVRLPCPPDVDDDDYISKEPGLYPDILLPVTGGREIRVPARGLALIRVEVESAAAPAGEYTVRTDFKAEGAVIASASVGMRLLGEELPPQRIVVTQWIHADCLAQWYEVEPLSDEHFRIMENYIRVAAENGNNMILTPLFTPALDTAIGGERLTVQLLDARRDGGEWSFGYGKLDRFIEMAKRCGMEYFEMPHLFTQWGSKAAPKIMATADGEYRRVFGWDTPAMGEEYRGFLKALLPDLRAHLRELGLEDKCVFHVSDEPSPENIDSYRAAAEYVRPLLRGCVVADALSHKEFYTEGLCPCPIVVTAEADGFLPLIPEGLWVYYCCAPTGGLSNRAIAMPLGRERVIGAQMWKGRAGGFLHWGYNFWLSQCSTHEVNPFYITDGDYFAVAGDAFLVYPGKHGEPLDSLRLHTFAEALRDVRALDAAEAKYGRTYVESVVAELFGEDFCYSKYPAERTGERILELRRRLFPAG